MSDKALDYYRSFSIRTMFAGTFVIAILLAVFRLIPYPISVLVAGAMPAPTLTAIAIQYRPLRRPVFAAALLLAWSVFYVVSIGPVSGLGMWLGLERDPLFGACFYCVYAPLMYLCESTPLAWHIEWYTDYWQHAGLQLR